MLEIFRKLFEQVILAISKFESAAVKVLMMVFAIAFLEQSIKICMVVFDLF